MKEVKLLLLWFSWFLVHDTGDYLVNTIIYEGLGYKEYKLYKYYRIFNSFNIVKFISKHDSLGKGENKMQKWLFDYHDKIILRRYYK